MRVWHRVHWAKLLLLADFVALVILLAWWAPESALWAAPLRLVRASLLGGFIGGFTNSIAIWMMFTRSWLPWSGVILKKRDEITESLAQTVEGHIITSELVDWKLREALRAVDTDRLKDGGNAVIDTFRERMLEWVNSSEVHDRIKQELIGKLGVRGKVIDLTGILDYDVLVHDIQDYLDRKVEEFKVDDALARRVMTKVGSLEDFLFKPQNPLLMRHYDTEEPLAAVLFNELDVKQVVIDNLSEYPPEAIRDIIQENIGKHLVWLEFFGVLLGWLFGAAFALPGVLGGVGGAG